MLSIYNYYIRRNNSVYIYNSFSKHLVHINENSFDEMNKLEMKDRALYEKLVKEGIIYAGEEPEYEASLKEIEKRLTGNRLELMILSSTACNFDCKYCYEAFEPSEIDEDFERVFVDLIEQVCPSYTSVFIEWFGGEPLLAKNRVISISEKVKGICKNHFVPFLSSITTNGFFLDYETFRKLINANVVFFQVTVDGDQEWHDKYRPQKNGEGSYETILNNLINIKKCASPRAFFRITIRCNVCNQNVEACKKFENTFQELFGGDERFKLFQFPISDWGGKKVKQLEDAIFDEYSYAMDKNLNYRNDIFESIESSCCIAAKKNGYVIDPDYRVYKCSHELSEEYVHGRMNLVGKLSRHYGLEIDRLTNMQWYTKKIDKKCEQCSCLPNCITICPLTDVKPYPSCVEKTQQEIVGKIEHYIDRVGEVK